MSISTKFPQAQEAIALTNFSSNTIVAVTVLPQEDCMPNSAMECPPQAIALTNISTSYSEKVHHLYARMHSIIDTLVNHTPPSIDS